MAENKTNNKKPAAAKKPAVRKPAAKPAVKKAVAPSLEKEAVAVVEKFIRKFAGVVVSNKNDKTVIVSVESVKMHPKYKKRYTVSRRYKVHDEKNQYKEGDKVSFIPCRPLSRDKRWRVLYN